MEVQHSGAVEGDHTVETAKGKPQPIEIQTSQGDDVGGRRTDLEEAGSGAQEIVADGSLAVDRDRLADGQRKIGARIDAIDLAPREGLAIGAEERCARSGAVATFVAVTIGGYPGVSRLRPGRRRGQ